MQTQKSALKLITLVFCLEQMNEYDKKFTMAFSTARENRRNENRIKLDAISLITISFYFPIFFTSFNLICFTVHNSPHFCFRALLNSEISLRMNLNTNK